MNGTRIISFALALALALAASAAAQMYRYTDRNGNVVFTDTPPAGSNAGEVKLNNERVFRSAPRRYEPSTPPVAVSPPEPERRRRDAGDVSAVMYMTPW